MTGKAGFIASSKNKTWKQTIVLSESDVFGLRRLGSDPSVECIYTTALGRAA
jgi:hypothetical protein